MFPEPLNVSSRTHSTARTVLCRCIFIARNTEPISLHANKIRHNYVSGATRPVRVRALLDFRLRRAKRCIEICRFVTCMHVHTGCNEAVDPFRRVIVSNHSDNENACSGDFDYRRRPTVTETFQNRFAAGPVGFGQKIRTRDRQRVTASGSTVRRILHEARTDNGDRTGARHVGNYAVKEPPPPPLLPKIRLRR